MRSKNRLQNSCLKDFWGGKKVIFSLCSLIRDRETKTKAIETEKTQKKSSRKKRRVIYGIK